jgi:hypothetical protein
LDDLFSGKYASNGLASACAPHAAPHSPFDFSSTPVSPGLLYINVLSITPFRVWQIALPNQTKYYKPSKPEIRADFPQGLIGKSGTCLLGLNKNKGEEILLRLRTSDLKGFRPVYAIMETLIHELCHIVHSEHDHKWDLTTSLTIVTLCTANTTTSEIWPPRVAGFMNNLSYHDI